MATTLDNPRARQFIDTMLQDPTVRVANPQAVEAKLAKILADGPKNLHFICDFDMTMSKQWVVETDGRKVRNMSSHGILACYHRLSAEFKAEAQRLYDKYYPIEISQEMSYDDKVPHMMGWWNEAHAALVSQDITREDIAKMVKETPVELREGLSELLISCRDKEVPLLVFSAGIRDVIEEVLSTRSLLHPNMHVVANKMGFNVDTGFCDHFEPPLIHVFNKSEFQLESTPRYHAMIEHRRNVILIGDSKGDLQMSQGIRHDLCLNIGFLNHDVKELVGQYEEAFDIVLTEDQSFTWVNKIVEEIQ